MSQDLRSQLREIVRGLKNYLEEEKAGGFPGWPRSPAPPSPAAALQAVRSELGNCRRCKLHARRTQIVFGTGNPGARLVFIGEAPGRDEDLQGEPFVGKAGQLLTRIIESIALRREEVYIANILKCRPPENRDPEPDEIAACEPFLIRQLAALRPRLICALGSFATRALLKSEQTISALRGRFHSYHGIPLMPTYHPAYLLRNPNRKREVWEDMKKIKQEYDRMGSDPSSVEAS